ncbi:TspO and MBR related proteins [Filimonas lacunae]|uniref:TspO and MBR related proteins n=1 Tax=Filimonas lacunae TaxID=477680 RepID=A0A173MPV6_9BACT|nr:TspO/MBR family protein [Filimonas lacunae]BAV09470.1 benzodiazepine receptor TspO [Filimonas lacunae]SIS73761.1 TspO and MBR related proteins [Filimonas lacunae]
MKANRKLVLSILLPILVGSLASIPTSRNVRNWYVTINKPGFNPPNWLFAPVWTTLYVIMGISLYCIWKLPASVTRNNALKLFMAQLALNFLWSFLFFEFHLIAWALVDIILLLLFIILCIAGFSRISRVSAWLLVPYLAWVSFATALNYTIYKLN